MAFGNFEFKTTEERAEEERKRLEEAGSNPLDTALEDIRKQITGGDPVAKRLELNRRKKAELDKLKPPKIDSVAEAARIRAILARMQFAPAGRSATIATSTRGVTDSASLIRSRLTGAA